MIPVPSCVRVWLAVGRTDMRRGMNDLALQVQEALRRDPHAGDAQKASISSRGGHKGPADRCLRLENCQHGVFRTMRILNSSRNWCSTRAPY
jgi:IS66 Orf2 like protein